MFAGGRNLTENASRFLELVSKDEVLCEKMKKADKAAQIDMAKELGIELSDADFEQSSELSDDELDAVAGGGTCACVLDGGGTAD